MTGRSALAVGVLTLLLGTMPAAPTFGREAPKALPVAEAAKAEEAENEAADPAAVLDLAGAVSLALENNPTVAAAARSAEKARLELDAASKEGLPTLGASYGYLGFGNRLAGSLLPQDNYAFSLVVNVPIYQGGATALNRELKELVVDQARLEMLQVKNDLVYTVRQLYWRVVQLEAVRDYLEADLRSYQQHLEVTQAFFDQELVAKNSLLQAKVACASANQGRMEAAKDLSNARRALAVAMGAGQERELRLLDPEEGEPARLTVEEYRERALVANPELAAYRVAGLQARKESELRLSGYVPSLSLTAAYLLYGDTPAMKGYQGYGFGSNLPVLSLNLNWDLFDWGRRSDLAAAATKEAEALEKRWEAARDRIMLDVQQAFSAVQTSRQKMDVSALSIEQARENLRIVKLQYSLQVASSQDVLDALALLGRAQMEQVNNRYSQGLAEARLDFESGADIPRILEARN